MCNGFSTRTSRGGAMAFLNPLEDQGKNSYQVTLEEAPGTHSGCVVSISPSAGTEENKHDGPLQMLKTCWLQIQ